MRELLEWRVNSEYTEALEKILQQLGTKDFDNDETNSFGNNDAMIYSGYRMLRLLERNEKNINYMLHSRVCENKKRKFHYFA